MAELLIVKPSSLGDIVHGLLVAEAIHAQMPDARISWVAREIFAPLVRTSTCVHEVHTFERHGGTRGFLRLLREIREQQYDYVLDMQGLARSGLITFFARGERKIGRRDARELSGLACNLRVGPDVSTPHHAVEILREFLPALGLSRELPGRLNFRSGGGGADPLLGKALGSRAPVVLFPESRRPEKEWPRFGELARALLAEDAGRTVIWAGSGQVTPPGELEGAFIDLSGKTRLEDLPVLIARAGCCVANDSGPMHLAAAVGCPLVALFGPTVPERFGPWPPDCPRHAVLRAPEGDLAQLEVADVLKTVDRLHSSTHKKPSSQPSPTSHD